MPQNTEHEGAYDKAVRENRERYVREVRDLFARAAPPVEEQSE